MNTTELIVTIKPDLAMLCDSEKMTTERHAALSRIVEHLTPPNLLTLVEALESAQRENTDGVAGMAESYETTISMLRSRIAELEEKQRLIDICQGQGLEHRIAAEQRAEAAERRVAELEVSHEKLRERMAAIHNTIRLDGAGTSLSGLLSAAKTAWDESALGGIKCEVKGE